MSLASLEKYGSRRIDVVLIEPMALLRASLRMLLEAEPDMQVVGEAEDVDTGLRAVKAATGSGEAVALVGLELTGERDAFWLIRSIREVSPRLVVLATGTELSADAISQALFVGADGFIHKNSAPARFVEATRRGAHGELVLEGLPRGALGGLVDRIENHRAAQPSVLSDRECEVLEVAAEGLTAREIGRKLGICERTVTTHLNHIYRKLGASGRVSALAEATRLGLMVMPAQAHLPLHPMAPAEATPAAVG